MDAPNRFSIPTKIAAAAVVILLVDAAMMAGFGDRQWRGLETLLTAANLTPLAALFWPVLETGGYAMLFGIDYARQKIWQRRQREIAQARAEGREEGREEGIEEGYQAGYRARIVEEQEQTPPDAAEAQTPQGG